MKKAILLLMLAGCFAGCNKKDNTVNNYTTVGGTQPAFVVNGVNDIIFINDDSYNGTLALTVQYLDSAQGNVTLSLSVLPAGIAMDTTWITSGIPTFTTVLTLFDTSAVGVTPGSYPMTLTATAANGEKKNYPFNLKVLAMPTIFMGKYSNCQTSCDGITTYTDSVYVDATIPNKVWFTNFANSGNQVYGIISNSGIITIPSQTVGGVTYYNNGNSISLSNHSMSLTVYKNSMYCGITMN